MSYDSQALKELPSVVSREDRDRLTSATALNAESRILLYEEMIERYSDSPAFFLVRLAETLSLIQSGPLALDLYYKVQNILSNMGVVDKGLDALVQSYADEVDEDVSKSLDLSQKRFFYQAWKPSKQHFFPTTLPHLPPGADDVKDRWQEMTLAGSPLCPSYLTRVAIDTHQLESVFLLTEESIQDLIRRGISEGVVECLPESALQDAGKVKSILSDTLAAYKLLDTLVSNVPTMNRDYICRIHAQLMNTCRFSGERYIPAGRTRTETRKTVVVSGAYTIECCPFPEVDAEVDYSCKMAKQWIKSWKNPFATASWIHLIFVRCHPFEDGNGRLVRLLSSIPLMKHGYPPISVALNQRGEYYTAINQAYEGDHIALVQCMLRGMQETITSVQSL